MYLNDLYICLKNRYKMIENIFSLLRQFGCNLLFVGLKNLKSLNLHFTSIV